MSFHEHPTLSHANPDKLLFTSLSDTAARSAFLHPRRRTSTPSNTSPRISSHPPSSLPRPCADGHQSCRRRASLIRGQREGWTVWMAHRYHTVYLFT